MYKYEVDHIVKEVEKLTETFGAHPSPGMIAKFVVAKIQDLPTTFSVPRDGCIEKQRRQELMLGEEVVRQMLYQNQTALEAAPGTPRKALGGGKASGAAEAGSPEADRRVAFSGQQDEVSGASKRGGGLSASERAPQGLQGPAEVVSGHGRGRIEGVRQEPFESSVPRQLSLAPRQPGPPDP